MKRVLIEETLELSREQKKTWESDLKARGAAAESGRLEIHFTPEGTISTVKRITPHK